MFFLIPLLLASVAEGQTQYPALPDPNLVLPTLNRSTLVVITGGKNSRAQSIANAAALQFYQMGATVAITTRNLKTFNYSSILNTTIKVYCLILGGDGCDKCDCTAFKFAHLIRERYGKNPDIYINAALTTYNGDLIDYTSKELNAIWREYITDPIEIERVWLENNNPNQPMKFLYVNSWAFLSPPWYQNAYNLRQQQFFNRAQSLNAAARYPNVEFLQTLCVFTATNAMLDSVNPSATRAHLCSQEQFQIIFTAAVAAGNSPSFVALAIAQATTLRAQLNYETIFDASGVFSASIPGFITLRATTTGNQFTAAYRIISLTGYGINITQQTCPMYYITPATANVVNNMLKYGMLGTNINEIISNINKAVGYKSHNLRSLSH